MNIKNVLFIAATLLIVTTNANANTVNNNTNVSTKTEYSSVSYSGFSLGFKSSNQVIKAAKQGVNIQAKQINSEYKTKNLVLGFNNEVKISANKSNIVVKKANNDNKTPDVNKVADSFNIGFDS